LWYAGDPVSISVPNQRLRDNHCRRRLGVLLLAFLVEQDHTATQNRDADTCDYERRDRIGRRIATHRMSETITKIKRLISLRQRQATKPVGPA
jgi:hypothetical protein